MLRGDSYKDAVCEMLFAKKIDESDAEKNSC